MDGFQFNFFNASTDLNTTSGKADCESSAEEGVSAKEIKPQATEQVASKTSAVALDGGITLSKGIVTSQHAADMLQEPQLLAGDLVPRKYEGGFKLWEGALDLCNYLIREYQVTPETLKQQYPEGLLKGKKVLELGCGHGLPGILCLLAGANVHFQDFNKQVITSLTVPNVQENLQHIGQHVVRERARYFAGDWAAVGSMLAMNGLGGFYDIILTAETIYNEEGQERLLSCIKQVLQPPHGVVLVAAKSFYYGVGGSTASFTELVKADRVLECKQVWKVEDGVSNKREILKLNFPESITPYFL